MILKSSKNKLVIIIIAILLILLIVSIVLLVILKRQVGDVNDPITISEDEDTTFLAEYGENENNSINRNSYFDVNSCIKQYLNTLNVKNTAYYGYDENDNYTIVVTENEIKQNIYDLLSKKYIDTNNITLANLYNYVKTYDKTTLFVPLEELAVQKNDNVSSFIIHGLVEDLITFDVIDEIYAIVNIDAINERFSVEPIYGNYSSINEIKVEQFESNIQANENNNYTVTVSSNEEIVKDYINMYKRLAIGKPEKMYELLDEEYKKAKFKSLDLFKEYITKNKDKIIGVRVEKYQLIENNGYKQYVCIDQKGNYYIFKENAVLNFTVFLDNYTVDLPEFVATYNASSESNKVLLNIQKVFQAINNGDYEYVYNKLDDTFKANYFKTQADLENYLKNNLYDNNKVSYGKYEKNGDVYVYTLQIKDASGKQTNTKSKNIVIQLKQGTDFVMSFNVK